MTEQTVLVTGGSGFIAGHCVQRLLEAGYRVRTTVRSTKREAEVRARVGARDGEAAGRLSFFPADLTDDAGWTAAARGADFVLHVASPFPAYVPRHDDDLVRPARDGALRVLRAARRAEVKRVVLTSSVAAILYGHAGPGRVYTEEDWSDVGGPGITAYAKSKTLAERAAWKFVQGEGKGLELSVINPAAVFGPVLGEDDSTSVLIVRRMLNGTLPLAPRISLGVVDVRDVADLHLRAMTHPAAVGQRFVACSGDYMRLIEMAAVLRRRLGKRARWAPTHELPDWAVRLAGKVDRSVAVIVPELKRFKNVSAAKAMRTLGWAPRDREEALVSSAESLLALGPLRSSR